MEREVPESVVPAVETGMARKEERGGERPVPLPLFALYKGAGIDEHNRVNL